jgi:hypothetical protein
MRNAAASQLSDAKMEPLGDPADPAQREVAALAAIVYSDRRARLGEASSRSSRSFSSSTSISRL